MGRSGSSSKRKHSKKKSHKVSSEVRKKKKIRRNKSKKLRVHDDSFSSCSDDESTSSSVFSSSSSENEYKSKKSRSRSRARNEVKRSKKRVRKRSLSEDSSSEDSSPVKKRKRSRKKSKKIKKDKKPKRDSYNYTSSSNSSSDDVASRGRSTKGKIGNMENRSRSSSLPIDSYDDENENVTVETNSRRLKSVITVVNQENDEQNDMKKEEEIVYDYDDYPSCKSNDSNEVVDFVDRFDVSGNVGSEVDDLESILRKKALENLSKFREAKKPVVSVDDKNKSGQTSVDHGQQLVNQRSRFTWRRDSSATTGKEEPGAAYGGPQSSGSQPVVPKNKIVNEISEIRAGTDTNDSSSGGTGTNVDQKSTPASTNVDQKSTPAFTNVDQKSTPASTNVDQKSTPASTEAGSSNQKQDEFEKKTMTVMRGGELVQVSYKVYIPNKAPALARRQLKR